MTGMAQQHDPTNGRFTEGAHDEVVLGADLAAEPRWEDAVLADALEARNDALMLEGMQVGPPSPRWRDDSATFDAAESRVVEAFAATVPDDFDEQLDRAVLAATEEVSSDLVEHRGRLAAAFEQAGKARTASEAVDILDRAAGRGFSMKRRTRAAATAEAAEQLADLDRIIATTGERLGSDEVIARLDEPMRSHCAPIPSKVIEQWTGPAKERLTQRKVRETLAVEAGLS
jgi:hypothetical protein